jgi:septal ring factor EnvC (AmiA/AmiB activator)
VPPADNSRYLTQAAQRRSVDTRRRALASIEALAKDGELVTPTTVARLAGVSRQWLYTCDEVMTAIAAAQTQTPRPAPGRSGRAASIASLKRRLEAATDTNKQLRQRVAELEAQVANLYGELRTRRQNGARHLEVDKMR